MMKSLHTRSNHKYKLDVKLARDKLTLASTLRIIGLGNNLWSDIVKSGSINALKRRLKQYLNM